MTSAPPSHPWRPHWSTPSFAGKKVYIDSRVNKHDRPYVERSVREEGGEVVAELTSDVAIFITARNGRKPTADEAEALALNEAGASIEIVPRHELTIRLAATRDEAIELLRAGPAAHEVWPRRCGNSGGTVDLSGADLSGLALDGFGFFVVTLDGVDFRDASLAESHLPFLTNVRLDRAKLRAARIAGLHACSLVEADLERAHVSGPHWRDDPSGDSDFTRVKARGAAFHHLIAPGATFAEADLARAAFFECRFHDADFSRADLSETLHRQTDFARANLAGANFAGADLPRVSFRDADLRGADFRGANLYGTDFTNARLDDADLAGANVGEAILRDAQRASARGTPVAAERWSPGPAFKAFVATSAKCLECVASLIATTPRGKYEVSFRGRKPSQSPFTLGASMRSVEAGGGSQHSDFTTGGGSPRDAFATVRAYVGPDATIAVADARLTAEPKELASAWRAAVCELFDAIPPSDEELQARERAERDRVANLRKSIVEELRGGAAGVAALNAREPREFRDAGELKKLNLERVRLDGLLAPWGLELPQANLKGASLVGARLQGAKLAKATLAGATLDEADLDQAKLDAAVFDDATARRTRFKSASLKKARFDRATLADCVFEQADLRGADLSQAVVSGGDWSGAQYDENTLLPADFPHAPAMRWRGKGLPPHELAAELNEVATRATAGEFDAAAFLKRLKKLVDGARIDKSIEMLKADSFELFADLSDDRLVGIVKSQSSPELLYACRLASSGDYACCTQNLNPCGGLRGAPCKHILTLAIGLMQKGRLAPEAIDRWCSSARGRKPTLDKDAMTDLFLRYKGAQAGELDWRPTETTPEDFYSF